MLNYQHRLEMVPIFLVAKTKSLLIKLKFSILGHIFPPITYIWKLLNVSQIIECSNEPAYSEWPESVSEPTVECQESSRWVWMTERAVGPVGNVCVLTQCPILQWRHLSCFTIRPISVKIARGCGNWCVFLWQKNNKNLLCLLSLKVWHCSLAGGIGYLWFGKRILPVCMQAGREVKAYLHKVKCQTKSPNENTAHPGTV